MSTGGPVARRTKQEAEGTRTRIVDAAERVFRDKGVAHASLEDVAAAARVTRGAIYWHFRDKAALFEAMMRRVELPAQVMMERAEAAGATNPLEMLRASACEVLLRAARDAQVRRVFEIAFHKCEYVGDAAGIRDRQLENHAECLSTIEVGIRASVRQGLLPHGLDPRLAAIGTMAYISGILYQWILNPESFSLERHAQTLVDTYFRGLAATPPRPARARGKSTDERGKARRGRAAASRRGAP
jgi:TetR/AcrR family acrAB operon transcriptional repressor